jgi:hypothetical protein
MTRADRAAVESLPPQQGKQLAAFLAVQYRADKAFRRNVTVEADLVTGIADGEMSGVETLIGQRASRFSHGPGGGRRRHHIELEAA